jgi:hypothetical protein
MSAAILDQRCNRVGISGRGGTTGPVLVANIATATSTTPMQNRSELVTRSGLPLTARREVVPRAISSVSQTRVWNVLIDVVAQSGRYPPGETDPKKFIVEGEQHYCVHVAIDRFTGQVIDRQVEVVKE